MQIYFKYLFQNFFELFIGYQCLYIISKHFVYFNDIYRHLNYNSFLLIIFFINIDNILWLSQKSKYLNI